MKKVLSQIIVLFLLTAGYCPLAFATSDVSSQVHFSHAKEDVSKSNHENKHVACCDDEIPDRFEGVFQYQNEVAMPASRFMPFDEAYIDFQSDFNRWRYFANNSDPPHFNLIGTLVSLK